MANFSHRSGNFSRSLTIATIFFFLVDISSSAAAWSRPSPHAIERNSEIASSSPAVMPGAASGGGPPDPTSLTGSISSLAALPAHRASLAHCYNLPHGVLGGLSHLLTLYALAGLVMAPSASPSSPRRRGLSSSSAGSSSILPMARLPLPPALSKLLHRHRGWLAMLLAALTLVGTVPAAASTLVACGSSADSGGGGSGGWEWLWRHRHWSWQRQAVASVALGELFVAFALVAATAHRGICLRLAQTGRAGGATGGEGAGSSADEGSGEDGGQAGDDDDLDNSTEDARGANPDGASMDGGKQQHQLPDFLATPFDRRSSTSSASSSTSRRRGAAALLASPHPQQQQPLRLSGRVTSRAAPHTRTRSRRRRSSRARRLRRPEHLWHPSTWLLHVYLPGLALGVMGAASLASGDGGGSALLRGTVPHLAWFLAAGFAPLLLWAAVVARYALALTADATDGAGAAGGKGAADAGCAPLEKVGHAYGYGGGPAFGGQDDADTTRPDETRAELLAGRAVGELALGAGAACLGWLLLCAGCYVAWTASALGAGGGGGGPAGAVSWMGGPANGAGQTGRLMFWAYFAALRLPLLAL